MRKKAIIFPIFISAWLIILVHNIVPHHHHDQAEIPICEDCYEQTQNHEDHHGHEHNHEHDLIHCHGAKEHSHSLDEILNHKHCEGSVCHFSVEILTQISLDNTFILSSTDYNIDVFQKDLEINWLEPVFICKPLYIHHSQLRAPPIV